jgi:hypothetical protein
MDSWPRSFTKHVDAEAGHQIDKELNLIELAGLTPQQQTAILNEISALRAQQKSPLAQLKYCCLLGG